MLRSDTKGLAGQQTSKQKTCPRCKEDHFSDYSYCDDCRAYMREYRRQQRQNLDFRAKEAEWARAYYRLHPEKMAAIARPAAHSESKKRHYAKKTGFKPKRIACGYCGEMFLQKRGHQKYCCRAHKIAAWNSRGKTVY